MRAPFCLYCPSRTTVFLFYRGFEVALVIFYLKVVEFLGVDGEEEGVCFVVFRNIGADGIDGIHISHYIRLYEGVEDFVLEKYILPLAPPTEVYLVHHSLRSGAMSRRVSIFNM